MAVVKRLAVGPIETMVPRLPGQKVSGNWRHCGVAVGPIETMVPRIPGQKVNGIEKKNLVNLGETA